ncbi:hypothetical protein VTL71DRAFT_13937 [Oculimacula yallundae]|uniref:Actin-like ATPase domain-containing protein n=1 Tax=Oculimacula yallundae TaxID=86028 RepID=A0ABR4CNE6_9HELO
MAGNITGSTSPFIVIGIDYGTTYSGAAWAKSGALNQVEVISQWSSQTIGATDSDKVPSDIAYDEYDRPAKWGFGLHASDTSIRWVKLLLSPLSLSALNTQEERVVDTTRRHLREIGKTAIEVIADYLRFLWSHILARLTVRLTAPVLDNMVLKVVLTVPAIWDHGAQQQMRTAARKAGILDYRACGQTEITLIAEPAAAALATYHDAEIRLNPTIEPGDSFVVCDAGGGTVDLISYTVQSFEPFHLRECIGATGDLCGAVYVDREFLRHIHIYRKHMKRVSHETEERFMEREWENNVKRNFDGTAGPWLIETPQVQQNRRLKAVRSVFKREESTVLRWTGDYLCQIFAEVVPKIIDLLRDQVQGIRDATGSPPKVIILVGGFGGNRYLLDQVQQQFRHMNIEIQQPTRSWSAVCRGAVHRGVQGGDRIVTNHISKFYYGVLYKTPWIEGEYILADKDFDARRQIWQAINQMDWYLRKSENVLQVLDIEHKFTAIYEAPEELSNQRYDIYYSDHDDPGTRLVHHTRRLCKLRFDLSQFSFTSFPSYTNSLGKDYRQVTCILRMAPTVSSLDWEIWCQGIRIRPFVDYEDVQTEETARRPT